jgi:DNA-directed RNA polymerase subunit RPC12/RpoP
VTDVKDMSTDVLERLRLQRIVRPMRMGGAVCSECRAGFRRVELESEPGTEREYRCPLCSNLLETFNGKRLVAYRLTIVPPKYLDSHARLDFCSA